MKINTKTETTKSVHKIKDLANEKNIIQYSCWRSQNILPMNFIPAPKSKVFPIVNKQMG